jgi:hypothetical protein
VPQATVPAGMETRRHTSPQKGFCWNPAGLLDLSTDEKWDAWGELMQLSVAELVVALHTEALEASARALADNERLMRELRSELAAAAWSEFVDEHPELAPKQRRG